MKRQYLVVAAVAAVVVSAGCGSDPLKGCSFVHVDITPPVGIFVAVGDSTTVGAQAISDCSAVGSAVDFSIKAPLATLRVLSNNGVLLKGVTVGRTMLYVTPRDYPRNRDSVEVEVIGANP